MSFRKASPEATRRDPMQEFADTIIAELEKGVKPWVRPWDPDKCAGPQAPMNPTSGSHYHGVNVLILGMHPLAFTTSDPRWMTYQQAAEKKWQVRKGSKATIIFFTKQYEVEDDDAEGGKKAIRFLRSYAVFHASQIEGIPSHEPPKADEATWTYPEAPDLILKNSGATICIGGDRAFYSPGTDHIQLPPESAFRGPPEWAACALHELGHWTGAPNRLARDLSGAKGSALYAREELRAELSSAFLAGELGIPSDIPNHASYIDHWLAFLKTDKREIFRAAADAQHIVDMILAFHPDFPSRPMPSGAPLTVPTPL
ncbi:MAG: zincin-like metallopeptidase domain-containing protein [Acidobacteriaceae bacterium]